MRAFISYSHDSPEHMIRVLALCDRLRADGVDCIIDQYEMSPSQGWPRWTDTHIEESKYVLVVCTEAYERRFKGKEQLGKGLGVKWEGAVITQNLYDAEADNDKFIPVIFSARDTVHIPTVLRGATRYEITTKDGYEQLYRRLTNQPEIAKPPLGKLKPLPPLERRQEFATLSEDEGCANAIGQDSAENEKSKKEPITRRRASKRMSVVLLTLPTVLAGIFLLAMFNWRVPTHIRADLTVNKVIFTLDGSDKTAVLNSVALKSIVIEKFNVIKLRPESLTLPSGSTNKQALISPSKSLVTKPHPVVIKAKDERFQSNVSFAALAGGQPSPLALGDVLAQPSAEITFETAEDTQDLIVRIDGQKSSGNITIAGPIRVGINQCEVSGIDNYPSEEQSLTFQAVLLKDSSIEFDGQPDSLVFTVTVSSESDLFPLGNIPIRAIRFERQSEQDGKVVSSLVKDGELSYPGYEKVDNKKITSTEFISLEELHKFSIEAIKADPAKNGLTLTLQGVANRIIVGSTDFSTDRRLTVYDVVSNNHQLLALFGVACWVFGTSLGAYKLIKGLDN